MALSPITSLVLSFLSITFLLGISYSYTLGLTILTYDFPPLYGDVKGLESAVVLVSLISGFNF